MALASPCGTRSTPMSRGGQRARSPCHSLDQLRASRGRPSDRGLVRPAGKQSGLAQPQPETHAQSESRFGLESPRRNPLQQRLDLGSSADQTELAGPRRQVKKPEKRDEDCMLP